MRLQLIATLALLAVALPFAARPEMSLDVEVFDRESGRVLPVYWHDGERHIAGEPGHEYEIRLRNRGGGRLLAVTSVDGVNVISGRTATPHGSGYVLDPWTPVSIDGWRKSLDTVAAFYFTALPDSYAARTGRPDNVGVIGVAIFREVERMGLAGGEAARSGEAAAPAASGAVAESRTRQELGTGHGRRLDSGARYTTFERANETPDEVIRIYYDSRRNLLARRIIPQPDRLAGRTPDPFPAGFVPDP